MWERKIFDKTVSEKDQNFIKRSDLKWRGGDHVSSAADKANRVLEMLKKPFWPETMKFRRNWMFHLLDLILSMLFKFGVHIKLWVLRR